MTEMLFFLQAKKVTMMKDTMGSTVPIISVNYSKLIKGFKKLKMGQEDFGRYIPVIWESGNVISIKFDTEGHLYTVISMTLSVKE